MRLSFFMPMDPPTTTYQEHKIGVRHGKPYTYEPETVKAARAQLAAGLAPHRPAAPFTGGVQLVTKWGFPPTKAHPSLTWRTTKPDTDNLQKMLKDCMTRLGFWEDDSLVVSEICEKFFIDVPGIYIEITPIEEVYPINEQRDALDHA